MSQNKFKPISRTSGLVIQELNKEILIYDQTNHKAFNLNETSALIWQSSDGKMTVSEISDHISQKLKSAIPEDFVWLALTELKEQNLIENVDESWFPFKGLSRREVIRKVGLATIVSLPMVWSLVAPTATQAQSTCGSAANRPLGCSCTANTQCTGTSTTRCCSNVPGDPRTCVVARTLRSTGQTCGNNCDCVSNSCVGPAGGGTCA